MVTGSWSFLGSSTISAASVDTTVQSAAAAGTTGELVASRAPLRLWLGRHYDGARAAGVVVAVVALLFTTSSWWLTILVLALTAAYEVAVWKLAEPAGATEAV